MDQYRLRTANALLFWLWLYLTIVVGASISVSPTLRDINLLLVKLLSSFGRLSGLPPISFH